MNPVTVSISTTVIECEKCLEMPTPENPVFRIWSSHPHPQQNMQVISTVCVCKACIDRAKHIYDLKQEARKNASQPLSQ